MLAFFSRGKIFSELISASVRARRLRNFGCFLRLNKAIKRGNPWNLDLNLFIKIRGFCVLLQNPKSEFRNLNPDFSIKRILSLYCFDSAIDLLLQNYSLGLLYVLSFTGGCRQWHQTLNWKERRDNWSYISARKQFSNARNRWRSCHNSSPLQSVSASATDII